MDHRRTYLETQRENIREMLGTHCPEMRHYSFGTGRKHSIPKIPVDATHKLFEDYIPKD